MSDRDMNVITVHASYIYGEIVALTSAVLAYIHC